MAIKSVRMDDEEEQLLARVRRLTGLSASEAIKRGLRALEIQLQQQPARTAFELYSEMDLGPGGYASGPARRSRQLARDAIKKRNSR